MPSFKITGSKLNQPYEPSSRKEAAAVKFTQDLPQFVSRRVREITGDGRVPTEQDFEEFWLGFCSEHPVADFAQPEAVKAQEAELKPVAWKMWMANVEFHTSRIEP